MKVLSITGDKKFGPGHERYDVQRSAVDELAVVYWGRGSMWPHIPAGQFDVVTVQDPLLRGVFGLRAAQKIGARLNIQVHLDLQALPWWKRMLATFVLHRADSVRVVSEEIKSQVERMGVRATITVLPVFIDIEPFKAIAPQPHEGKNILWFGRFEDEKDPLYALEVFREVRKRVDAKLVMLGSGSLRKTLKARAQGLPVELPGWQDPKPYLARADVVLSTSKHESWGASYIEALAAGVPVVAPDVGVSREAGAVVVPKGKLAGAVVDVLQSGARGTLLVTLPTKEEWVARWKQSL